MIGGHKNRRHQVHREGLIIRVVIGSVTEKMRFVERLEAGEGF